MDRTRIHLIRHGQVEGYEQERYNGQADTALTEIGLHQYMQLCERLRRTPLCAIYSSDLSRCTIGAEMIARAHNLDVQTEESLREIDSGQWEGIPWNDIKRTDPLRWQQRLDDIVQTPAPGGESVAQMARRVRQVRQSILENHAGGDILLVGHGGVNRVLLIDALGAPLARILAVEQDFGCYNRIDYFANGDSCVHCMNS